MTVARDSVLESATFTTTTPHTFTGPSPAGTPRSVTVMIGHGTSSSDLISGAVTYGGVAMTRVATNGFAQDTGGEVGAVYAYHLGTGIPTGAQTVSITHTGTSTIKWAICALDTAGADTEIGVSAKLQGDQANPQSALDTSATSSLRKCIIHSGHDSVTSVVALSGMEARAAGTEHDFGTNVLMFGEQTTAATGSFTIGFTATTEDVAFIAIAIQEVAVSPATVTPAVIPVTVSLLTPTVSILALVTPAVIPVVVALPTPTVQAASSVTPAVIPVTVSLPTPITVVAAVVTPAVIAVTVSLPTPTVLAAAKVTPLVIPVTLTLPIPTVVGGAVGVVTPATIAATVSLPTPLISVDAIVTPAGIALVATLPTPAVTTPGLVTPAGISLVVTLPTPLATVGAITFWTPNPVLYDPIGAGDEPPWN